jgi:5-oxoprolinase (ATP-hydrolysing)
VILLQFKKRSGSGGKGKYHGGDGAIRDLMFLEDMEVSILSERRVFAPYGLQGGGNGLTGKNVLITNEGITKNVGGKNCFKVNRFDRVVIYTPGGGGYGL